MHVVEEGDDLELADEPDDVGYDRRVPGCSPDDEWRLRANDQATLPRTASARGEVTLPELALHALVFGQHRFHHVVGKLTRLAIAPPEILTDQASGL
jgi:hypothetical protein